MRLFLIIVYYYYTLFCMCIDTLQIIYDNNRNNWSERFRISALREKNESPFLNWQNMPEIHRLLKKRIRNVRPRIVGGHPAIIKDFPFVGSLRTNNYPICGASLISDTWVITAAHCVEYKKKKSDFLKGVSLLFGSTYNDATYTIVKPVDVFIHTLFDSDTMDYDCALFQLESPIAYTETIANISIPDSNFTLPMDVIATAIGWGDTSEGGSSPNELMKVNIPIVQEDTCKKAYGDYSITPRMICAGQKDKDTCQGDSGGPLFIPYNGKNLLIGLTSWGLGCARDGYPGVYCNIKSLVPWIIETINDPYTSFTTQEPITKRTKPPKTKRQHTTVTKAYNANSKEKN